MRNWQSRVQYSKWKYSGFRNGTN